MAGFTPGHFSLYPRITCSKPRKSTVWKEFSQDNFAGRKRLDKNSS